MSNITAGFLRQLYRQPEQVANDCYCCGIDKSICHSHHVYPLVEFANLLNRHPGLSVLNVVKAVPLAVYVSLCPTCHILTHRMMKMGVMQMVHFKMPRRTFLRIAKILDTYAELHSAHEICIERLAQAQPYSIDFESAIDKLNSVEEESYEG